MCGREDPTLVAKKVSLYGGHNRGVLKYDFFFQYKVSWENYKSIRKELMRFKRMWVHKHFFQSKMVLDILNGVQDMDKENKKEEEVNLEEEVIVALIGQPVNLMKQTGWPVTLIVAIQNPSLKNQKLNTIIVKR